MKKLIFACHVFARALALVMALASCNLNPVPGGNDASRSGDDGDSRPELPRYVTVRFADADNYFDDTIGIGFSQLANSPAANSRQDLQNKSRALTHDNAVATHDLFEAVFYYPGNSTVARAVWDIGVTPELRGVYRTGGIYYGNVTAAPPTGEGSAMLFVGSKADKTLLALGRLCAVDGIGPTGEPPVLPNITPQTRSVTFEVTAIKAGTDFTADDSSFKTNFRSSPGGTVEADNTEIQNNVFIHYIGKKTFPFFRVNRVDGEGNPVGIAGSTETLGEYTFDVVSGSIGFDQYAEGFIPTGGYNFEVRNPRYPITNGLYQYSSIFVQDLRDGLVNMTNNISATFFENPVKFKFDTSTTPSRDASIFALVFEIYVYNLSSSPTSSQSLSENNTEPIAWRISPGAGTTWLDLDDGNGGTGGAILLGSGNVDAWLVPYQP